MTGDDCGRAAHRRLTGFWHLRVFDLFIRVEDDDADEEQLRERRGCGVVRCSLYLL